MIVQFIWKPAVAAVVAFLALGICYVIAQFINDGYEVTKSETYSLRALTTDEDVIGQTFLFVGSFGEHSTISYIRANGEDEGLVIREVGTLNATIYERDEDATMSVHTWRAFSPWLVPGGVAVKGTETYTFTVPVGSVSNQIEVKP